MRKLFFVNKHVIDIFRKNSEIIIMNVIYKINKYEMSLFVIMSHTTLNSSFYIAFAFLKKKKNFVWVLQILQTLYKHLDFKYACVIVIDRD